MDEKNIFQLIAQASQKTGVRLLLIGGFAVNEYGYARSTQDIDFMIQEDDFSGLRETLSGMGFREVFKNDLFARFEGQTMPLDILFLDRATFDSVWNGGVEATVRGIRFRLPSLEHLIALKLHAVKQGGERRGWKDLDDIVRLVLENQFDLTKLKVLCKKFGSPDAYEMILQKTKGT